MRRLLIVVGGSALSVGSFAASRQMDGFVGAAGFMLSLFFGALTIGLLAVWAVHGRLDRPRRRRPGAASVGEQFCSECGRERIRIESLWLCVACDHVAAGR